MKRGLFALAIVTFALGIAEFGMMGILSDVARGIDISIVKAGHFISAYSLGVAIGAPCLIVLRKLPLKKLLLLLTLVMVIGNTFAAIAPDYHSMLIARFISGLPHGCFFGAGAIVCSRLAARGKGAEAVAIMVGGMTVANVLGVPIATFFSNLINWRISFGIVALSALLGVIAIQLWIPHLAPLPNTGGIKGQFRFLHSLAPWLIYLGVFFGQASVYCYLSYVEPIMTHVTGFSLDNMTWIMMAAGIGMVVGNALSGKLADRYGAVKVCMIIALSLIIVMPAIYLSTHLKILSIILLFVAAAGLFGIGGPLQYLIVQYAKGGEMLGGAGIQIAFNVSNAVSAALGGIVIKHGFGLASPALIGIPFALISAISLFIMLRIYGKN